MSRKNIRLFRIALLCAALALIALGIARGEVQTVITKSTRICMECIGLG